MYKIRVWAWFVELHFFEHFHAAFPSNASAVSCGVEGAESSENFEVVSMKVLHSSMEIADEFYSNLNDSEVQDRITSLGKANQPSRRDHEDMQLLREFLAWKKRNESDS